MRRILRRIEAGIAMALLGAGLLAAATVEMNHPTGRTGLFLVDKLGAHLRFFDPVTFREQASIEVVANPHDFALTSANSRSGRCI